ncbi:hypothetical protein O6H91_07G104900 [Diphasiastrum complanatum]|uniref:Uncharacterized protein n=3 Tax=Diphasiastrum complanatum TaxID=34168 RepID=A0ACC2D898_DIPCM|nr:hypothetical protein O6H91_07G104900 [Diphasiastrum complanatum]KAJ7550531.1 hypothetical protein O6H91_07G104900 [Diphasiastrum complanatum]
MWCMLIAAGAGYLAKRRWRSSEKLTKQPPVQETIGPVRDSYARDLRESLLPPIDEDLLPNAGVSICLVKSSMIEDGKALRYDRDVNAMNNSRSVFTFSSKNDVSAGETGGAVSSRKKGTIRSKIAQKGWENRERRFRGWPNSPRTISNKASVSEKRILQPFLPLSHDQESSGAADSSCYWEAVTKPSPPRNERGWCLSPEVVTVQKVQHMEEATSSEEEPARDPIMLDVPICCDSDPTVKDYPNKVPGETRELSNIWTIDDELPQTLHATYEIARHRQTYTDPGREKSECEGWVEQETKSEYGKEIFQDAVKEFIETFSSRVYMPEEQSRNSNNGSLQDTGESKFGGILQRDDLTQRHSEIRKREMEQKAYSLRAKGLRTTLEKRPCQSQVSDISPLTWRPELKINNDTLHKTSGIGDAEAFSIKDLQEREARVEGKVFGSGYSTGCNNSEAMDILGPLFSDNHLVTKPKTDRAGEPAILQKDETTSNGETSDQKGKLSYSSQKGQLLSTKGSMPGRALLPLFLKKRKITECLQSISPLGTFPSPRPSEMIMSSNKVLPFTVGMGVGLLFTWSACHDEIKKLKSLLNRVKSGQWKTDPERDVLPAQMCYKTSSMDWNLDTRREPNPVFLSQAKQTVPYHLNSFIDLQDAVEEDIDDDESIKSVLTEECMQKEDNIAQLEAELEAELKLMEINFMDADYVGAQIAQSAIGELDQDGFANLSNGGFTDRGLPRMHNLEHNKSYSAQAKLDLNSHPVSPRELEHRLRLLLEERQEEQIFQLHTQLQITKQKLESKEVELREWKEQVRRLVNLSSISADSDAVELSPNTRTTQNPCTREASDIFNGTQDDKDLIRSCKQQEESLMIQINKRRDSIFSFGPAFSSSEERVFCMGDYHEIDERQTVCNKELDALIKQRESGHSLENMGKSFKDHPTADSTLVERKASATMKKPEANLSSFDGCESDSNSSCISTCSTTFCNYIDALVMPPCRQQSFETMEKAEKNFLPVEKLEFSYLEPVRNSIMGRKTSRLHRKFRKKNSKV